MSIKPRNKGFEAYVTGSNGKRYRKTFPTHEEAAEWEAKIKLALAQGKNPSDVVKTSNRSSWTIQEAVRANYEANWRGSKSEKTAMLNAHACMDFFGKNRSLKVINAEAIQEFIEVCRQKGNSNATINRKTAALSKVLRYAYQTEKIDKIPYIPRLREALKNERYLSVEEEERVYTLCVQWNREWLSDLITFLLNTGCRIGEALKLQRSAIKDTQVVFYDTKNGKNHTVPLNEKAKDALDRQLNRVDGERVFDYTYTKVEDEFKRICEVLEIDDTVTLHTLRHTFGSRLVQRGVPIQTVSQLMNHSSLQVTMRYAHLSPSNLTEAINVL